MISTANTNKLNPCLGLDSIAGVINVDTILLPPFSRAISVSYSFNSVSVTAFVGKYHPGVSQLEYTWKRRWSLHSILNRIGTLQFIAFMPNEQRRLRYRGVGNLLTHLNKRTVLRICNWVITITMDGYYCAVNCVTNLWLICMRID